MDLTREIAPMAFGFIMLGLFLWGQRAREKERRELVLELRRMARLVKAKDAVEQGIMEEQENPSPLTFTERNTLGSDDLAAFFNRETPVQLDPVDRSLGRSRSLERRSL